MASTATNISAGIILFNHVWLLNQSRTRGMTQRDLALHSYLNIGLPLLILWAG